MSEFHLKQWVRFHRAMEVFAAGIEIPAGTVAQVIDVMEDGIWVRPTKRFPELDEWLNGVELWDWRRENQNPQDAHAGTYIEPADCPFD